MSKKKIQTARIAVRIPNNQINDFNLIKQKIMDQNFLLFGDNASAMRTVPFSNQQAGDLTYITLHCDYNITSNPNEIEFLNVRLQYSDNGVSFGSNKPRAVFDIPIQEIINSSIRGKRPLSENQNVLKQTVAASSTPEAQDTVAANSTPEAQATLTASSTPEVQATLAALNNNLNELQNDNKIDPQQASEITSQTQKFITGKISAADYTEFATTVESKPGLSSLGSLMKQVVNAIAHTINNLFHSFKASFHSTKKDPLQNNAEQDLEASNDNPKPP